MLVESIRNILQQMNLKYYFDKEKGFFYFTFNMDNSIGVVRIIIQLMGNEYITYAVMNSVSTKNKMPMIAEYLHRVNYGLVNGSFELNYDNGEIRYKIYVNGKNTKISEEVIKDSIYIPILMCKKFGEGILKILTGSANPESVLRSIKN